MNEEMQHADSAARSETRGKSKARWVLLTLAGGTVLAIVGAEVVVRGLGIGPPVYELRRFEPAGGVPYLFHADGRLEYRPSSVFASVYDPRGDSRGYFGPEGKVVYHINEHGMRGPAVKREKPPDCLRIVCLGDSITFGEGVRYEDAYPARLEALLSEAGAERSVQVLNAGVQAYGTTDAAAFFLVRCAPFDPDVVILGFFLNDPMDREETIRQNDAATRQVSLSLPARLSRIWEIVERGRIARHQQEEYFSAIRRGFEAENWKMCRETLRGLRKVAEEDGFRLIVVVFPILYQLDENYPFEDLHAKFAKTCRDLRIEHLDLLRDYRGRPAESLWVHPTDQHPNEIAHRLAAEALARHLLRAAD